MGKYSGLLYCNGFFLSLLILTVYSVWILFTEAEFYVLKNRGGETIGRIVQFDVAEKGALQVKYVYQVGEKEYVGSRFYREKNRYDSAEIKRLVKQIDEKKEFAVYYALNNPKRSVCFFTNETLRFTTSGVMILIGLWGVFGLGYLQVKVWNRS